MTKIFDVGIISDSDVYVIGGSVSNILFSDCKIHLHGSGSVTRCVFHRCSIQGYIASGYGCAVVACDINKKQSVKERANRGSDYNPAGLVNGCTI